MPTDTDLLERLSTIYTEHGPSGVIDSLAFLYGAFVLTAEDGRVLGASEDFARLLDYRLDEILGLHAWDLVAQEEREGLRERIHGGNEQRYEIRLLTRDGEPRFARVAPRIFDVAGSPVRLAEFIDTTETTLALRALQESEAKFRSVFELAAMGIARVNPDGSWLECNDALCRILGYDEEELRQTTFQKVTHPDDLEEDVGLVNDMLARRRSNYSLQKRYIRKDGQVVWANLTVSLVWDEHDQPAYFVSLIDDISALKEAQRRLEALSLVDELTGVANRRQFDNTLDTEWKRARRHASTLSLIMVDIDHFKLYNDSYGHIAGDEALKHVAAALAATLNRGTDLVARYGGEEFVILLPDTPHDQARLIAEACRERVVGEAIPHQSSPVGPALTISLGVASFVPSAQLTARQLIDRADQQLYAAKKAGRNRVMAETGSSDSS